jgi:hypothetical protein
MYHQACNALPVTLPQQIVEILYDALTNGTRLIN